MDSVFVKKCILLLLILIIFLCFQEQKKQIDKFVSSPLISLNFSKNQISSFEDKFITAKKYIPQGTVLGYMTDRKFDWSPKFDEDVYNYYLVQYAVSPNLLKSNPQAKFVIGYFKNKMELTKIQNQGLILIKDLNHGIYLFRRR